MQVNETRQRVESLGLSTGRSQPTINRFVAVLVSASVVLVGASSPGRAFEVPNPFERTDYFYKVTSEQTSLGAQDTRSIVTEILNIDRGLSYSLFQNLKDSTDSHAIIADGPNRKVYRVRNAARDGVDVDCELDHTLNHRHIFPYQYTVKMDPKYDSLLSALNENDRSKTGANNNRHIRREANIFGVGAVILNAVDRRVSSDKIASESPYPVFNLWRMQSLKKTTEVKLMFKKPVKDDTWANLSVDSKHKLLKTSSPKVIEVTRSHMLDHDAKTSLTQVSEKSADLIDIKDISVIDKTKSPVYDKFKFQLDKCRESVKSHRVFPSLMKALSQSEDSHYWIQYFERRYNRGELGSSKRHNAETVEGLRLHMEGFSFARKCHVHQQWGVDREMLDHEKAEKTETFMRIFSSEDTKSRFFHIVRDKSAETCKVEKIPAPPSDHMMRKEIVFTHWQKSEAREGSVETVESRAHLVGVGALLMNAADFMHKKVFRSSRQTIAVPFDPNALSELISLEVDEWFFHDHAKQRNFHFYFLEHDGINQHQSIADLARIDVRDAKAEREQNKEEEGDQQVEDRDSSMIVRYDFLSIETQNYAETMASMFNVPKVCEEDQTVDDDDEAAVDSDRRKEDDEDTDSYNDSDEDTDVESIDADDEVSEEDDDDDVVDESDEEQEDEIPAEFDQSFANEDLDFPDFFEFLRGNKNYEIVSKISMQVNRGRSSSSSDGETTGERKFMIIKENVDLEKRMESISIYFSERDYMAGDADEIFYVDYTSESILRRIPEVCVPVYDVSPWMRLISSNATYETTKSTTATKREKSRIFTENSGLRTYGVGALWRLGSQSEFSSFLGAKHQIVRGAEGNEERELVWMLNDDGDERFITRFNFLYSHERHRKSRTDSRPNLSRLRLDSIHFRVDHHRLEMTSEFSGFDLKVLSVSVPQVASIVMDEECAKELEKVKSWQKDKLKPMADFIEFTGGKYSMEYTIHRAHKDHEALSKSQVYELRVKEQFDLSKSRGKMAIEGESQSLVVYADGDAKKIYSHDTKNDRCREIGELKSLVDDEFADVISTGDFNLLGDPKKKLWGLAAIWAHLAKQEYSDLRISYEEEHGLRSEVRTYEYRDVAQTETVSSKRRHRIQAKFVEQKKQIDMHTGVERVLFVLRSLKISPIIGENRRLDRSVHSLAISLETFESDVNYGWDLPAACKELQPRDQGSNGFEGDNDDHDDQHSGRDPSKYDHPSGHTDDEGSDAEDNESKSNNITLNERPLPQLYYNQFHIKSAITISRGNSETPYIMFTLDEWSYDGKVKIRTHGLKKNINLLVYSDTGEIFDFSQPYKCQLNKLPNLFGEEASSVDFHRSSFVNLWHVDKTNLHIDQVESLKDLYFGAMSLWKLAYKSMPNMKIKPIGSRKSKRDDNLHLGDLACWSVTYEVKWEFDLCFSKHEKINEKGTQIEWFVLRSIEIPRLQDTDISEELKVEIDVLNYSYDFGAKDTPELFLIHEAHGCARNPLFYKELEVDGDEFKLKSYSDYYLSYEASFEFVEKTNDEELGELEVARKVLPTLVGSLFKRSKPLFGTKTNLFVNNVRTRYQDGNVESKKIVHDNRYSQLYVIDKISGICQISKARTSEWTLVFPTTPTVKKVGPSAEKIVINSYLFHLLFLGNNKRFTPIKRYKNGNHYISAYELTQNDSSLRENSSAPITIVREYRRRIIDESIESEKAKFQKAEKMIENSFLESLSIRVYFFNSNRSQVEAVFTISIISSSSVSLSRMVKAANVARCYNNGLPLNDRQVRSYVVEYNLGESRDKRNERNIMDADGYADSFTDLLLADMSSMQLVATQVETLPRVEFTHSDSIKIYFRLAEAPSAMSYFSKVDEATMTDDNLLLSEIKVAATTQDCSSWCDRVNCIAFSYCEDRTCKVRMNMKKLTERFFDANTVELSANEHDPSCTYFYKTSERAMTLDLLEKKLKFNLDRFPGDPVDFHQIIDDSTGMNSQSPNFISQSKPLRALRIIDFDHKIDEKKVQDLKTKMISVRDYKECIDQCEESRCGVLSYCKRENSCLTITNSVDLKWLKDEILETESTSPGCSITALDWLVTYNKYENTLSPTSFKSKRSGYTDLECASACESDGLEFNCLSFDFCQVQPPKNTIVSDDQPIESFCMLQSTHVSVDTFDRNILQRARRDGSILDGKQVKCNHYSRSILADFNEFQDSKLKVDLNSIIKVSDERCALDCIEDDDCLAFQYCFDSESYGCFLIRLGGLIDSDTNVDGEKNIQDMLEKTKHCSLFVMKNYVNRFLINDTAISSSKTGLSELTIATNPRNWSLSGMIELFAFIMGAAIIGSVVSVIYHRYPNLL